MQYIVLFFLLLITFINKFRISSCAITVDGVQCGQRKCGLGDYCSLHDGICKSCASICNQEHHNFEETECNKYCQDYLHSLRYMLKNESGVASEDIEKLKGEVKQLSSMITTMLVIVSMMLLTIFVFLCVQCYRWKVKKNITLANLKSILFKKREKTTEAHTEDSSYNKKPDLRLDITNISSVSDHSPNTAMTTVSVRRPAEDSALDYAYDNHAMTSTSQ